MQDERGIYYFPEPQNRSCRMYVRKNEQKEIEFRLWVEEKPEIWEKHPWLGYDVVREAANLYKKERNPDIKILVLYDLSVAQALLAAKND